MLRKAAGKSVLEFAESELFEPLGMGHLDWYADKTGLQSGGMSGLFRSRDLLKLGELYLRHGIWKGIEVVPSAYVAESVKPQNRGEFYGEQVVYGYGWWITRVAGHDAFYARGYGGQYLMVIPQAGLIVLCTSDWQQPEYPSTSPWWRSIFCPQLPRCRKCQNSGGKSGPKLALVMGSSPLLTTAPSLPNAVRSHCRLARSA